MKKVFGLSPDSIGPSWPWQPHVRHGSLRRLGALADLEEFSDFRRWPKTRELSITATMTAGAAGAAGADYCSLAVDPAQAAELYLAGATLAFNGVEEWHAVLGRWLRDLARDFGLPAGMCHCNVYVSPAGAGVPKHFDSHHVIIVQLIGAKLWSFAPNRVLDHPIENHVASFPLPASVARYSRGTPSRFMPRGSTRVTMRPGSALFLPAGFWHATRATEPSLSVTFGLRSPRWFEILRDALAARLERLVDWREPAWGAAGTTRHRAAAEKRFASLLKRLSRDVGELEAGDLLRAAFPSRRR